MLPSGRIKPPRRYTVSTRGTVPVNPETGGIGAVVVGGIGIVVTAGGGCVDGTDGVGCGRGLRFHVEDGELRLSMSA
jgi:hypothetical protein